jgi:Ni/Co efflux regulator RcnB
MKKLVLLVVALAMFGGATVNAQDAKAEAKKKAEEAALKKYDKNGNGKLDDEEKAAQKKDREEMIKKYDKNGDGSWTTLKRPPRRKTPRRRATRRRRNNLPPCICANPV